MTTDKQIFHAGSSLIDAYVPGTKTWADESSERSEEVACVAEFFNLLRDRLHNEPPELESNEMPDSLRKTLTELIQQIRRDAK